MVAKAEARYVSISPQKARLVIDLIRGQKVDHALVLLQAVNKRIAPAVEKLVRSAVANAENRKAVDVQNLIVIDARIDGGPMFKRLRPRARGMAFQVKRRMAHIRVEVESRRKLQELAAGGATGPGPDAAQKAK